MLNFFTTSNGFRSTLPVVSNLTAMNVWDGVCMCFIYASLLEFVCVNYVGRKRPEHNVVYRPGENPVTQVKSLFIYPLSISPSLCCFYFYILFFLVSFKKKKQKNLHTNSLCSNRGTFRLYLFPSYATYASKSVVFFFLFVLFLLT